MKKFEKKLLKLSPRTLNCLRSVDIYTIEDLSNYKEQLTRVRNFGRSSMLEVENLLSIERINQNNGQIILNGISIESLVTLITNAVIEEIKEVVVNKESKIDYDLLTREQTCDFLNIDKSTLFNWDKQNILKPYRIGGRVYYKKSEIESKLK
jgi:hypothetical protein